MASVPKLPKIQFDDVSALGSHFFSSSSQPTYRKKGGIRSYSAYPDNWGKPGLWILRNGKLTRVKSLHASLGLRPTYRGVDYTPVELVKLNKIVNSQRGIIWTFTSDYRVGKRVMEKEGSTNYYYWPVPSQTEKVIRYVASVIQQGVELSTFGLMTPEATPGLAY
jgi:hypothetical protein